MNRVLKTRIEKLLCIAFIGFWGFGCTMQSRKAGNLSTVSFNDLVQRVTVPGVVSSNRKTMISAPYSGYIKKIYVQVGQKVAEGAPIVSVVQSLRNSSEEVYPLRAPFAGTVAQVLKTEGEYVEQYGNSGGTGGGGKGNSIIRIDDLSHLFVDATSPEIEVDKLQEGQVVVFLVLVLLRRSYKGKI